MKLRLKITKDKSIRFISHLEYVRTIERAIRRAKLPAAYSEGFNPHLKFSLASALGVGVVSYAEFCEIELAEPMTGEEAAEKCKSTAARNPHFGGRCNSNECSRAYGGSRRRRLPRNPAV